MQSAIVIGGGPAGSMAAMLLARAGFSVDLLEQHLFPRDKVCGECLSALGVDVFQRAGVLAAMQVEGPTLLTRTLLHPREGPTIELPLPRASMGISRHKMDVILFDAAVQAGVRVHQPARCEAILTGSREPSVRWRNLRTNEIQETPADWIVVADGKGSLLPKSAKTTGDLGIKTHFTHVDGPRDAIELFAGHGNYGGLAAIEGGRWNAAFSVPADLLKEYSGDLQRVFDRIVSQNAMLWERLRQAKRVGPWLASPLPRFAVSRVWPQRVVPIGNAAAAMEPACGEGMGLALRSAELAAAAIVRGCVDDLPEVFDRLWRLRRAMCRGIAMIFSSEHVADAIAPLMAANVGIPAAMMRLAGKGDHDLDRANQIAFGIWGSV